MVVVSGHACAGDWIGAGRMAGPGRPIHLFAADRPIHRGHVGSSRFDCLVAPSTRDFERCCDTDDRRFKLACLGPNLLLAR